MKGRLKSIVISNKNRLLKRESIFIIVLFSLALAIRLIGIRWGLPSQNEPTGKFLADEPQILNAIFSLSEGVYHRLLQNYPFFYYLSFLVFLVYFVLGRVFGTFSSFTDFAVQRVVDISQFLLVGRIFVAITSSLTVVSTYLLGKKLFNKTVGVFAALFLLLSFGHIVYAKVFRLDTFLPLVFVISFYYIVGLLNAEKGGLRPYILCGFWLGIAMATKITAWSLMVPYMLVPFLRRERVFLGRIAIPWPNKHFVLGTIIAIVVYAVLAAPSLPNFDDEIQSIINNRLAKPAPIDAMVTEPSAVTPKAVAPESSVPEDVVIEVGNLNNLSPYRYSLVWHITYILPRELGVPAFILAIFGLVSMLFNRKKRSIVILLYAMIIAYMVPVGYALRTTWRDMLPMLPFLAISAGYGLFQVLDFAFAKVGWQDNPKRQMRVTVVVLILLLAYPTSNIYKQKRLILNTDTRDVAKEWIQANIPEGRHLALEPYGPGIRDSDKQSLIDSIVSAQSESLTSVSWPYPTYEIFNIKEDLSRYKDALEAERVVDYLSEKQINYVVVSSGYYGRFYNDVVDLHSPMRAKAGRLFHDTFESKLVLIAEFVPHWNDRPGPVIKIYEVPENLKATSPVEEGSFDPFPGMERPASAFGYYQSSPR